MTKPFASPPHSPVSPSHRRHSLTVYARRQRAASTTILTRSTIFPPRWNSVVRIAHLPFTVERTPPPRRTLPPSRSAHLNYVESEIFDSLSVSRYYVAVQSTCYDDGIDRMCNRTTNEVVRENRNQLGEKDSSQAPSDENDRVLSIVEPKKTRSGSSFEGSTIRRPNR